MDDQASKENPSKDFNKLDLSQLQGFSFGTQWTQDKSRGAAGPRDDEGADRPRRQGAGAGDTRRDRRSFRKPDGASNFPSGAPTENQPPRSDDRPTRREGGPTGGANAQDPRGPRRDFRSGGNGPAGGGPRRDGGRPAYGQGDSRGPARSGSHQGQREGGYDQREQAFRGPYISPFFNITFYPEDTGFTALTKAIRSSCRTYELFEIARVIVGKNDRFVATIQRKQPGGTTGRPPQRDTQPQSAELGASEEASAATAKPAHSAQKLLPITISILDGFPFETEEDAIAHIIAKHLGTFFDRAEVEIDPPKGNYQVINKCGITGELLGPPNYHLYNQIVQAHHANRVARMGFESFRARIETLRDPEVVAQWLEKMKKATRYTWKYTPPAEGATAISFDSFDDARTYLLTNAKDKILRNVETARMHGKLLDTMPQGELQRAIEGTLDRQRRFPLDTANALRGRLRREGYTIFKKGSKGISYVCAVKRKFRVPGQTFSDSIGGLISFIEANPMVKASELAAKFLNIQQPEAAAPSAPAAAVLVPADVPFAESHSSSTEEAQTTPPIAPATSGSIAPFTAPTATLSAEEHARLHRLSGDLRWLVSEGYVTEFIDGCLFAPPAMTEARKQEAEKEENDPENFPDAPAADAEAAPKAAAESHETVPVPEVQAAEEIKGESK